MPQSALTIRVARPDERRAALHLALETARHPSREAHVAQLVRDVPEGDSLWAGLWTAWRGEQLVGALSSQLQPGRCANVSAPQLIPGENDSTGTELLTAVMESVRTSGVRLAQALMETDTGPEVEQLRAVGFEHVSDLLYLVSLDAAFPTEPPRSAVDFETFSPAAIERLASLVARTYESTQDCPRLNGVRDINDTLTGYRSIGIFDPSRWLIVQHDGQDVGCVLLADHPAHDQWELVYMGLVPSARGNEWGLDATRHAQWLTRMAKRSRLVLAVDARNAPAIAMYAAAGFVAWDRRSVLVRIFDSA